jgi:hypothetical protein
MTTPFASYSTNVGSAEIYCFLYQHQFHFVVFYLVVVLLLLVDDLTTNSFDVYLYYGLRHFHPAVMHDDRHLDLRYRHHHPTQMMKLASIVPLMTHSLRQ